MANPEVHIGKPVQLSAWDMQRLEEHAYELRQLARHRPVGWFAQYVQRVTYINKHIRKIVGLSQLEH